MSSLNKQDNNNKNSNRFERISWNQKYGVYKWSLPEIFDVNVKGEIILPFSRRPIFLNVNWFAKQTGPFFMRMMNDQLINTDDNKSDDDDYDDEDNEVKEILSEKKKRNQKFQRYLTPKSFDENEATTNYNVQSSVIWSDRCSTTTTTTTTHFTWDPWESFDWESASF